MKFIVHDVGHGFCAQAIAQDGASILFDCGHKSDPEYRPSKFLPANGFKELAWLYITNFDEDHISDLPNLCTKVNVKWICRNASISAEQLRKLKRQSGPISSAMESLLEMHGNYTDRSTPEPATPGIVCTTFCNSYPDFQDTNNLSLVTFVEMGGMTFLVPGDLEEEGWLALLKRKDFVSKLGQVDVFIASHHGRESGYCEDVFEHCEPDVFVFSDSEVQFTTQEMATVYGTHAKGTTFNKESRKVLTTRNDGTFWWNL